MRLYRPRRSGVCSRGIPGRPYVGPLRRRFAPLTLAAPSIRLVEVIYVALLFVISKLLPGYVGEPLLYGHSLGRLRVGHCRGGLLDVDLGPSA